jgi:hypothetical protein
MNIQQFVLILVYQYVYQNYLIQKMNVVYMILLIIGYQIYQQVNPQLNIQY